MKQRPTGQHSKWETPLVSEERQLSILLGKPVCTSKLQSSWCREIWKLHGWTAKNEMVTRHPARGPASMWIVQMCFCFQPQLMCVPVWHMLLTLWVNICDKSNECITLNFVWRLSCSTVSSEYLPCMMWLSVSYVQKSVNVRETCCFQPSGYLISTVSSHTVGETRHKRTHVKKSLIQVLIN